MNFYPHPLWYPVALSKNIKMGRVHKISLCEKDWILLRGEDGSLSCLEDRCPHQGVPLAAASLHGAELVCPYHGWRFSLQGICTRVPGMTQCSGAPSVPTAQVSESGGLVYVAPEKMSEPVPTPILPATWRRSFLEGELESSIPQLLLNFLDPFHTHFVHSKLVRTDARRIKVLTQIKSSPSLVEVRYTGEVGQEGWISKLFEPARTQSFSRLLGPHYAQMEYCDEKGAYFRFSVLVSPSQASRVRAFFIIDLRPSRLPYFIYRYFGERLLCHVIEQDKRILELQHRSLARFANPKLSNFGPTDFLGPFVTNWWKGSAPPEAEERQMEFLL